MNDFYKARIEALEKELKRVNDLLDEISRISTEKAKDIKVILSDPNYDKKLSELNKNYK